ncbi:7490_t:CDS:2 [Ambispora gerdemannii]|uniref:7490_t:CDS:1 n=1 Tax=Ambispora gerdemannii TaxID=144530 RepID=A0A9N9DQ88_9GLOM|nr:7490_t:CDS:2 [Ambispora gerdemannii]
MLRKRIGLAAQAISASSKFQKGVAYIPRVRRSTLSPKQLPSSPYLGKLAPELVSDILDQIFELLTQPSDDDILYSLQAYPNLYNCMLVNKKWCETAVRILYKHPWRLHRLYTLRKTDLAYDRCGLVRLYLTMLDREQRLVLLEQGINLPDPERTPRFKYASYLRCLDYGVMLESIWTIYSQSHYTYIPCEKVKLVVGALLKLFSTQAGSLTWLRFAPMSFSFDEMYFEMLADKEFNALLRPVEHLVIEANLGGCVKLYKLFSANFRNVRNLELTDLPRARNWLGDSSIKCQTEFTAVIESQHHLQSLTLKECAGYLSSIISAILSQSHTISHLKFIDCDFRGCEPWVGLSKCRQLISIEFGGCINISGAMIAPLVDAGLTRLKKVVVWNRTDQKACKELMSWASVYRSI